MGSAIYVNDTQMRRQVDLWSLLATLAQKHRLYISKIAEVIDSDIMFI